MSQNSGFWLFCWKVSSGFTSVLLYMLIGATFRDVYNMGPKGPIFGPFQVGPQSEAKFWALVTLWKSFHWFHIIIASHAHCKYLERFVIFGPWKSNFGVILCPKISQIQVFGHFLKKFSLVSHLYRFTCSLQVFFKCVENMHLRCPFFWATLGPQISKNSDLLVIFSKIFHWLRISFG